MSATAIYRRQLLFPVSGILSREHGHRDIGSTLVYLKDVRNSDMQSASEQR
jgi:hypothetical protein